MTTSATHGHDMSLSFIRQDKLRNNVKPLSGKNESREARIDRLNQLRQSSADFESYFIGQLITRMKAGLPEGGYLPKSPGSDLYESMADEQFARYLSRGNGIGLGQAIFNQMVRIENIEDLAEEIHDPDGIGYIPMIPPDHMKHPGLRQADTDHTDKDRGPNMNKPERAKE
jgi:Rod binding domain-containing protein